jgi:predicted N-acetyltransferase YhbS
MTLLSNAHRLAAAPFQALPAPALQAAADPVTIDDACDGDVFAREALLDAAFGPARFRKTCETLRVGRLPARGLALVARLDGQLVGTVRLWHIMAGGVPALMLGPLAVDARYREHGIGTRLMDQSILRAKAFGHAAILLVGDAPYYARFGFERRHTLGLAMPGPVEADRFLGLELRPGALDDAKGSVFGTGAAGSPARDWQRARLRNAA